jgi:murein DD-endopeptidase MepM/ murein hydrolase activator NlpD
MRVVKGVSQRDLMRGACAAIFSVGLAACSADTQRFGDNPFADRGTGPQASVTGSAPSQRAAVARVESRPLAAQPLPAASSTTAGHYPYTSAPRVAAAPRPAAPYSPAHSITHVATNGDTLMSLSRKYHRTLHEIVAANHLTYDTRLKIGDRIIIPGVSQHVAEAAPPKPALRAIEPKPVAAPVAAPKSAMTQVALRQPAANEQMATARVASPIVEPERTSPAAAAVPQFRWPVRGRVISGFGPMPNGQQNDGVNLSVPEGTAVRAAEDGVVAYSGNELKGYGNLILVRHANGFVTAYAHASELMVKRGDTVKRGQVIAKSGATGNVTAPQLHFEIRKGSAPVDPTQYLPGA